jgi:hypothetical protein
VRKREEREKERIIAKEKRSTHIQAHLQRMKAIPLLALVIAKRLKERKRKLKPKRFAEK